MMRNETCQAGDCEHAVMSEGCKICRLHLCPEHRASPSHDCQSLSEEDKAIRTEAAHKRELQELIARVVKLDLKTLVEHLRPASSCVVHLPDASGTANTFSGRNHIHVLVEFDDGVKWMARIRQTGFQHDSYDDSLPVVESEVTTQRVLHGLGVKVPKIWPLPGDTQGLNICMIEFMNGVHYQDLPDPNEPRVISTILDYARNSILRSSARYPLIGSLTGIDCVVVGPRLSGSSPAGPCKTLRERYLPKVDRCIERIVEGSVFSMRPVWAYLHQLEVRRLIMEDEEMCQPVTETYIKHGDDHLGNLLVDEQGHIEAWIDWEYAFVTAKAEAFAAPLGFVDTIPFHVQMDNTLHPMEVALAKAYDELGRPDLGDCVRGGKKHQRLVFSTGQTTWAQLRPLYDLFDAPVLGDGTKDGWLAAAKEKYADDATLKVLLERVKP